MLDIIYKCIDGRVAGMDDFTMENIIVMSIILKNYKIYGQGTYLIVCMCLSRKESAQERKNLKL